MRYSPTPGCDPSRMRTVYYRGQRMAFDTKVGSPLPPSTPDSRNGSAADPLAISAEFKATLRVLIVDDDRTLREGCANVLRVEGYNVTVLGRGDEAVDAVAHRAFDIIICDLYLSPVTGMDVLHAAMRARRNTLVIMITGDPSVTSSVEALRAGAWDYLVKPFAAS